MLSDQQLHYFDIFGYLVLPGRFAAEIDAVSAAFDEVFDDPDQLRLDTQGGTYVTGTRDVIPAMSQRHPVLTDLVHDRRVLDVADALLPDGYEFLPGDGSRFRSETTWHVDATGVDMSRRNIKMALYLQPVDADTGCLRVIPGTHRLDDRYTGDVRHATMDDDRRIATIGVDGADVPSCALVSQPGDLLVWDRRIIHASYGTTTERGVLAFGFKAV